LEPSSFSAYAVVAILQSEVFVAKRLADIRQWALIGAEQRLQELTAEAAAIHREFPELQKRFGRKSGLAEPGDRQRPARRRRRKLSADARRRISEAQKARWAKQKGQRKSA
jgi:hypothetical protein